MAGRATREAAAADAWRIIDEELALFAARRAERRAVPAVVALRRHFEQVRAAALAEAGGDAETATRLLVARLLHDPSEVLHELAAAPGADAAGTEELLRRLFRLGGEEEGTE
jgi:glutamyl-tRNA reductase